jgi:hypothetical protein
VIVLGGPEPDQVSLPIDEPESGLVFAVVVAVSHGLVQRDHNLQSLWVLVAVVFVVLDVDYVLVAVASIDGHPLDALVPRANVEGFLLFEIIRLPQKHPEALFKRVSLFQNIELVSGDQQASLLSVSLLVDF